MLQIFFQIIRGNLWSRTKNWKEYFRKEILLSLFVRKTRSMQDKQRRLVKIMWILTYNFCLCMGLLMKPGNGTYDFLTQFCNIPSTSTLEILVDTIVPVRMRQCMKLWWRIKNDSINTIQSWKGGGGLIYHVESLIVIKDIWLFNVMLAQ